MYFLKSWLNNQIRGSKQQGMDIWSKVSKCEFWGYGMSLWAAEKVL